jgi:hypothetical protein
MTSGNVRMGPDPDQILEALRSASRDDPRVLDRPTEEVSRGLVRGGYLSEEPDPVLVAEMLGKLEEERPGGEEDDEDGEWTEEASPT